MRLIQTFIKDPDATLDYGFDWTDWLEPQSKTILSSSWIVPAGITLVEHVFDEFHTRVTLTGGTVGQSYHVTNRITVSAGTTPLGDDRSLDIVVQER